jgi:hypothetical protein
LSCGFPLQRWVIEAWDEREKVVQPPLIRVEPNGGYLITYQALFFPAVHHRQERKRREKTAGERKKKEKGVYKLILRTSSFIRN